MQKLIDPRFIEIQLLGLKDWLFDEVLVLSSLGQIVFILAAFLVAYSARKQSEVLINQLTHWRGADDWITRTGETLSVLTLPIVWVFIQYISSLVAGFAGWRHHLLKTSHHRLGKWRGHGVCVSRGSPVRHLHCQPRCAVPSSRRVDDVGSRFGLSKPL